jgi:hypothetical protein
MRSSIFQTAACENSQSGAPASLPERWRWRVLRTSNGYNFRDLSPAADRPNSSKSEKPTGTPNQESLFVAAAKGRGFGERSGWKGEVSL